MITSLELANDIIKWIVKLEQDFLLEDLTNCETELEFAEMVLFLESLEGKINSTNVEKFISDLSIWERATLVKEAKRRYGI
jgi:hypothetical protein|tara:strand:- start:104 stop:346 length:243 start_codon:yes stop_codon:yes gene_type:complete